MLQKNSPSEIHSMLNDRAFNIKNGGHEYFDTFNTLVSIHNMGNTNFK